MDDVVKKIAETKGSHLVIFVTARTEQSQLESLVKQVRKDKILISASVSRMNTEEDHRLRAVMCRHLAGWTDIFAGDPRVTVGTATTFASPGVPWTAIGGVVPTRFGRFSAMEQAIAAWSGQERPLLTEEKPAKVKNSEMEKVEKKEERKPEGTRYHPYKNQNREGQRGGGRGGPRGGRHWNARGGH